MVLILNQISNQLRNTSDHVPDSSEDGSSEMITSIIHVLTASLGLVSLTIIIALFSKYVLWSLFSSSGMHHNPEEQARNRESLAQSSVLGPVAILSLFTMLSGVSFVIGCYGTIFQLSKFATIVFAVAYASLPALAALDLVGVKRWPLKGESTYTLGRRMTSAFSRASALAFDVFYRLKGRSSLDPEIVVGISNCLFIHTPMVPTNFSIFIQLFAFPVEHSRCRITSLAPWSQLSSILPSMLMKIYSHSKLNLLPALRLCLVVSSRNQLEQPRVNKDAKRAYNTIKTSNPLQNLYLYLLLSQLYATTEATDHWQDACRILKCLEYSEEHTSELVWLVDSIQLYTLEVKVDFTTRIVEFLRGIVVYLAKCPRDEHNEDLLRTATIMAAEWLISRQSSDNGNLPPRYILSHQDVGSDEENQEMFVLVDNQRLSPSERLQRTLTLYQGSQKTDSSSDFVIRTLLIPIMAIDVRARLRLFSFPIT